MSLKDQNIVYVDSIRYNLDPSNGDISNIINCPTTNMSTYLNDDNRTFDYNKINHLIPNPKYFNTSGNNVNMPFSNIPNCGNNDFSGCCVIPTEISNNDYFDKCDANGPEGSSTGFIYKHEGNYYNVCHARPIQKLVNMFSNFQNKKDGLEKFFVILLVTIVMILFYTLFSLPYEFWLRYGNSIQCIYYKVKQTCANMGSKKSINDGKLTIIEYKFPDNLDSYPYEACKPITSGGMKGGREKDGSINSNYIQYNENGSKCINVDFGDDDDDISQRPFPYNLGQYANDKTSMKNNYIAMILKGFSFYFLFTILFLRTIFNKVLSYFSKQYQKIYQKNTLISTLLLLFNFIITPFLIIAILVSVIFAGIAVFPLLITITDFIKSLNVFKNDIETCSSTQDNPSYYKIYKLDNLFYSLNPENFNTDSDNFHKNNKFFAIILGVLAAFGLKAIIGGEEQTTAIITLIALIIFPIGFFAASKFISLTENTVKILDLIKKILLNILLFIPIFFTIILTFAAGMTGSILAGLYMVLKLLYDFYITTYSNGIEFLDLFKNHSNFLTIILLISVTTSSAISGLGDQVTGTLGGLLALYLIYQLYKITQ
tara:strand:- start:3051 stop:4847 length:1797 start_codon:yes stop_codon:yes gene_type:complete